jgi:chromosome segregation ATPase
MEGKIDILIKSVNDMKLSQNKLVTSINSLSNKLLSLTKKIKELTVQLNTLSSDNDSLKLRVSTIEEKIKDLDNLGSTPNDVIKNDLIAELIDRQNRQNNVLLFNLPESFTTSNNSINEDTTVKDILNFLGLQSQPTFISRLGFLFYF